MQLQQSEYFLADFEAQFRWYLQAGGPELAKLYRAAMQTTLVKICQQPETGRFRFPKDIELQGMRSCLLVRPFHRHLLFYRLAPEWVIVERTIHGARDLPRRLKEPPTGAP